MCRQLLVNFCGSFRLLCVYCFGLLSFRQISREDQTESAAILKIKESMQEEAKRFEKDSDQPDYYMQ